MFCDKIFIGRELFRFFFHGTKMYSKTFTLTYTFRKTSGPDRILLTCPRARSMKLVVLITTVGYRLSF